MKKFYSFLMALTALLCSTAVGAQSFTIDDVNYTVTSTDAKTAAVAGSNWPMGTLTIPATVTYESVDYTVTEINSFAFQFCEDITGEVTLPATIESIGGGAFADCSNVTSFKFAAENANYVTYDGVIYTQDGLTLVMCPNAKTGTYTIRDGVTTIGWSAFDGCSQLKEIIIPSSVTTIENTAFCNCSSLTQLTIPASVTTVYSNAFGTGDADKLASLKNLTLLATTPPSWSDAMWCLPEGATVNVPAEAADAYATTGGWSSVNTAAYDGKCGDNAYWTLDEETGVLTIFGTGAMYDYADDDANRAPWYADRENISSVSIGSGITVIGEWALAGCLFTSIEFPNTLTTIKEEALSDCSALTSITIPASVTTIEDYVFACESLETIVVEAGNTVYDSRENCNAIIETATNKLIAGSANTVIPEGITTIGTYAFDNIDIKNLEIPASVTSIEPGAFAYTSLKSVKLPGAITTIERFTFYGSKIESIEIPASVTTIEDQVFVICQNLTKIISFIPAENISAPGAATFHYVNKDACTIYVPAGAKSTYAATDGWKDFTNIVEFNGKCGDNAYWALNEETGALTIFGEGAMYNYNYDDTPWYSNKENITSVTIEEGVTSIGESAFYDCTGLTSIEIPSSVTSIGEWAFWSCSGLTSIEIPSSVTSIGNYAFDGCNGLTSIVVDEGNTIYDSRGNCNAIIETASNTLIRGCKNTVIPEGVTSIGYNAFISCTGLTSIEIPSSVTSIGDGAFAYCTDLTSIEIPSSVTSIGKDAFNGCTGLTSIEIPSSVTSIGSFAFYYCSGLTSIEIPSSVTSIGDWAFARCTGLTSIVSHIAAEDLFAPGDNAFAAIDKDACTLYVPAGAKSTYAATDGWKDFTNIVETYDLTVTAAGYATMYLGTAVEIPAGVEAYTANRIEGDRLKMQAVEDVIPANTGVIIKAEEGKYTFIPSNETPAAVSGNLLTGTVADTYVKPAAATAYVLSQVDGVVGMYKAKLKADGTFKNNANKAYMLLSDITTGEGNLDTSNPGGQLSNGYRFDFSGTTAIESVETESAAPAVYYDLSGRRVENPVKGIYIVNGRKVLIK